MSAYNINPLLQYIVKCRLDLKGIDAQGRNRYGVRICIRGQGERLIRDRSKFLIFLECWGNFGLGIDTLRRKKTSPLVFLVAPVGRR